MEVTLRYLHTNFILVKTQIQESGMIQIINEIHPFLQSQSLVDILQEISTNKMGEYLDNTITRELIDAEYELGRLNKIREQFLVWSGDEKPEPEPEPDAGHSTKAANLLVLLIWIVVILF